MNVARFLLAGLGVLAASFALAVPATGITIPVDALVSALGNDYLVVAAVGGVAVVAATSVQVSRRVGGISQASPPETEDVHAVPTLGSDFDAFLDRPLGFGAADAERFQSMLTRLAVTTVVAESGCSQAAARERVEDGTWTEDPLAAAVLAHDEQESTLTARQRLRAAASGDTASQHGLRRAAREILDRQSEVDG